jgi:hypothetical protein
MAVSWQGHGLIRCPIDFRFGPEVSLHKLREAIDR